MRIRPSHEFVDGLKNDWKLILSQGVNPVRNSRGLPARREERGIISNGVKEEGENGKEGFDL